jgi:hypothetical protein
MKITMATTQQAFHAMRGHVRNGQQIKMDNGDLCTLLAVMAGWQLYDPQGRPHSEPTDSAHVVECIVYAYPSLEI